MQHGLARSRHSSSYQAVDKKTLMGLLISPLDTWVPRAEYRLCFAAGRARVGVWAGAAFPRGCPVPTGLLQPHPYLMT